MPISQDERLEILKDLAANWLQLRKAVAALTDRQLEQPGPEGRWSGKQLLAHIEAWDRETINAIRRVETGKEPGWPEDDDTFNAAQAEAAQALDLADVKRRFEATHQELMDLVERTPALSRDLVASTSAHYLEHVPDVRALKQRGA